MPLFSFESISSSRQQECPKQSFEKSLGTSVKLLSDLVSGVRKLNRVEKSTVSAAMVQLEAAVSHYYKPPFPHSLQELKNLAESSSAPSSSDLEELIKRVNSIFSSEKREVGSSKEVKRGSSPPIPIPGQGVDSYQILPHLQLDIFGSYGGNSGMESRSSKEKRAEESPSHFDNDETPKFPLQGCRPPMLYNSSNRLTEITSL